LSFVKEEKGNLLLSPVDIIGHQVNGLGIMGAGLAKQIKTNYPEVFMSYQQLCWKHHKSQSTLGICQIVNTKDGKHIANLFGQHKLSRSKKMTNETALLTALTTLKREAAANQWSVGLPYGLGAGLAGGNWNEIRALIEEAFIDWPVVIYRLD
jgi:O-acetyl-ADP-ribose deacetylase (regulator of RNase III)